MVSIPIGFSHQLRHSTRLNPRWKTSVSIPIGFSHQLRLVNGKMDESGEIVSIPIGFSHQLRPGDLQIRQFCGDMFQSLSGFLIS